MAQQQSQAHHSSSSRGSGSTFGKGGSGEGAAAAASTNNITATAARAAVAVAAARRQRWPATILDMKEHTHVGLSASHQQQSSAAALVAWVMTTDGRTAGTHWPPPLRQVERRRAGCPQMLTRPGRQEGRKEGSTSIRPGPEGHFPPCQDVPAYPGPSQPSPELPLTFLLFAIEPGTMGGFRTGRHATKSPLRITTIIEDSRKPRFATKILHNQ